METHSDFLYARPSFLEGLARIVDLGGTMNEYNVSPSGQEADAVAIWMDWAVIGQDMRDAIGSFEEEETLVRGSEE